MEYSNSQIREVIGEYIHNARDREIMLRRMIDGITLERLAEEFDMSVSQMKRIIKRESDIVFRHIRE
jgi:AraC-like DNA-binding protein